MLFPSEDQAVHFIPGVRVTLGLFCALLGIIAIQVAVLLFLNRVRENQREAVGKPRKLVDTSMETKYVSFGEGQGGDGVEGTVRLGQNALLDLTDFKNDEMIYCL